MFVKSANQWITYNKLISVSKKKNYEKTTFVIDYP